MDLQLVGYFFLRLLSPDQWAHLNKVCFALIGWSAKLVEQSVFAEDKRGLF